MEQLKNGKEFSNNATSKVVSVQTYNELMFAKDKSFDMRLNQYNFYQLASKNSNKINIV